MGKIFLSFNSYLRQKVIVDNTFEKVISIENKYPFFEYKIKPEERYMIQIKIL